jgi:hypothetical protein
MTGHRIKQYSGEEMTHERVVRYIKRTYPGVIFRTDFAAGIKMTIGQASKHKRLQYRRAFPDLFVFSGAMRPTALGQVQFFGFGLELKAANVKLKKRDGEWASDHIREQAEMMAELEAAGYMCTFACGYEEACAVLDFYLAGTGAVLITDFIPQMLDVEVTSDNEDPF